jgi:hypothetical protein
MTGTAVVRIRMPGGVRGRGRRLPLLLDPIIFYENIFQKNFSKRLSLGILALRLIDQRLKTPLHQESVMKYQEQFLTIWDTPTKAFAPQPKAAPQASPTPLKEMFFTIWDSAKNKTASPR